MKRTTRVLARLLGVGLLLSVLGTGTGPTVSAVEPAPPRLAVLTRPSPPPTLAAVAAMLQVKLSQDKVVLLERQELALIVKEQTLQRFFDVPLAAAGFQSAEFLVLLDWIQNPAAKGVRLRLINTSSGIRWLDLVSACDPQDADGVSAALAAQVTQRLRAGQEQRPLYVSILPFRNRTAAVQHDQRLSEFVQSLELLLARQPGVVVLERGDAEALRDEQRLTQLPADVQAAALIVEGELSRAGGSADDAALSLTLKARRLGADQATVATGSWPLGKLLNGDLHACLAEFVPRLTGQTALAPSPADPVAEGKRQAAQGRDLMTLGFPEESARCFSAALLLGYDRPEVRRDRVRALATAIQAVMARLPSSARDREQPVDENSLPPELVADLDALLDCETRLVEAVADNWDRGTYAKLPAEALYDNLFNVLAVTPRAGPSAFMLPHSAWPPTKWSQDRPRLAADYARFAPGELGDRERALAEQTRALLLRLWDTTSLNPYARQTLGQGIVYMGAPYIFRSVEEEDRFRLRMMQEWLKTPMPDTPAEPICTALRLADTRLCTAAYDEMLSWKNPFVDMWVNFERCRTAPSPAASVPFGERCSAAWLQAAKAPFFMRLADSISYSGVTQMRCAGDLAHFRAGDQARAADALRTTLLELDPQLLRRSDLKTVRLVADYYATADPRKALDFAVACRARADLPLPLGCDERAALEGRGRLAKFVQELQAKYPELAVAGAKPSVTCRWLENVPRIGISWILPDASSQGRRVLLLGQDGVVVTTDGRTFASLIPNNQVRLLAATCGRDCVWLLRERQLQRFSWEGKELETIAVPDWFGHRCGGTVFADPEDRFLLVSMAAEISGETDPSLIARLDRKTGVWKVLLEARRSEGENELERRFTPVLFVAAASPDVYLRTTGREIVFRINTNTWTVTALTEKSQGFTDIGWLAYELRPHSVGYDHHLRECGLVNAAVQVGPDVVATAEVLLYFRGGLDKPPIRVAAGGPFGHLAQTAYGLWCVGTKDGRNELGVLTLPADKTSR